MRGIPAPDPQSTLSTGCKRLTTRLEGMYVCPRVHTPYVQVFPKLCAVGVRCAEGAALRDAPCRAWQMTHYSLGCTRYRARSSAAFLLWNLYRHGINPSFLLSHCSAWASLPWLRVTREHCEVRNNGIQFLSDCFCSAFLTKPPSRTHHFMSTTGTDT